MSTTWATTSMGVTGPVTVSHLRGTSFPPLTRWRIPSWMEAGAQTRHRRGIARRLGLSFLLLLGIIGAAAYFGLASLFELHGALHHVEDAARGQGAALRLASAVRDQYAHMAHTLILGNDSHETYYREASALVRATASDAERATHGPRERDLVRRVRAESARLDTVFDSSLLPAVRRADRSIGPAIHADILETVAGAQRAAQTLSDVSAQAIAGVGAHARIVEHRSIQMTIAFLGIALVVAVAVAVFLHRSLTVPIRRLSEGTAQLAAGNLEVRLSVHGDDELADLGQRFNLMTNALRLHQQQLIQSEKLAGLGRMAAGVAHEINNPLAVIIGYLHLIRGKADRSLLADLDIVEQEAHRCHEIVEDLLDLTRTPPLEREEVDLRRLADDVVARLSAALAGHAPPVRVEGSSVVIGSSRKLRQVLQNLVKNAMEAAGPTGDPVRITIDMPPAGGVSLSVIDAGPGIKPADRGLLFEPFFTTKPRGTGLGLAVSRAIARAHGGDLELAESRELGGAEFRLTLPAARGA
jgi:two-component system, NtrC family, sensor kinase